MMWLIPLALAAPFAPDVLSAGQAHTCAAHDGEAWCWGGATMAQVKAGTWSSRRAPERVAIPGNVVDIAAGDGGRTCAATAAQEVWCWGLQEPPSRVAGVRATQVGLGAAHTCALGPDGVVCWGSNTDGQLGTGSREAVEGPVTIEVERPVELAVGGRHACARQADGRVVCWGDNAHGQLGSGTLGEHAQRPRPVMWVQDAVQVAAGGFHTCLLRAGGGVLCFGDNLDGQLGDGSRRPSVQPVVPHEVSGVKQLDLGFNASCAVREVGSLYCWGANDVGQLGHPDHTDQVRPVYARDVTDAQWVSVGQRHMCVRRAGGLQCVGDNQASQLGDGTAERRSELTTVAPP